MEEQNEKVIAELAWNKWKDDFLLNRKETKIGRFFGLSRSSISKILDRKTKQGFMIGFSIGLQMKNEIESQVHPDGMCGVASAPSIRKRVKDLDELPPQPRESRHDVVTETITKPVESHQVNSNIQHLATRCDEVQNQERNHDSSTVTGVIVSSQISEVKEDSNETH